MVGQQWNQPLGVLWWGHSPYLAALAAARDPGTAEKGGEKMWDGQQLNSGLGGSASSREPSLPSLTFFALLKALKPWLPIQELTLPGTEV